MNIIVLPAYNEGSCIGALLESFCHTFEGGRGEGFRIVVVNDGSSDDTEVVARGFEGRLDLQIINHPQNRGLAAALRTGFHAAVDMAGEGGTIITMDGDNSHLPSLMFRMLNDISEGCDIVIASRYQPGARIRGVSGFRKLLSLGAGVLFRLILPLEGVRDYTCGYRVYRVDLMRQALNEYGEHFITEQGFSCMVDVLLKLRRYDPIVREVPMILRYDQKTSSSKMNVIKTVLQTLSLLFRRRLGL